MRLETLRKSVLRMDQTEAIEHLRKIGVSRRSPPTNPKSPRAKENTRKLGAIEKAEAKLSKSQILELLKRMEGSDD